MTTLYEIELVGPARGGEQYYSTAIVQCDDFEPAGWAPIAVTRYARLLAEIAGPLVKWSISVYRPTLLSATQISRGAESIGPLDERNTQ